MVCCDNWKSAVPLLTEDIGGSFIPDHWDAKYVHNLRQEYSICVFDNFSLCLRLKADKKNAFDDEANIIHYLSLCPNIGNPGINYPRWDGSEASKLLKSDVDNNHHINSTPKELHLS